MRFTSLSDAEEAYNKLAEKVSMVEAREAAMPVVLGALIAKHQDYDQLQLFLTSAVEIADTGFWPKLLSPKQREAARAYVEQIQQIQQLRGEIRPLG